MIFFKGYDIRSYKVVLVDERKYVSLQSSDSEAPGSASVAIEPSSSAESSTIWGLSSQYYYLSVRAFFVTPLIFYCCTGSLSLGDVSV